jgi:hypothetical protein
MKIILTLLSLLFFDVMAVAQVNPVADSSIKIADTTSSTLTETSKVLRPDTPVHVTPITLNGRLLDDDPAYNPRYPWWKPALGVVGTNVFSWSISRYLYKYDWAKISPTTWKNNIKNGWEWDNDRFGINFIGHPHSGNTYFNEARSNGYSYWGSFPFAVGGSLMWEYFGENSKPSINDIINTPISGAFLGEVLYRVSSNILDDRTRGRERVFRELFAALINPPRALNRLTQGKMFRVTPKEVYQKEPLNITLTAGVHKVNENNHFGTGGTNAILNLQLDYGDPFEIRHRKAFDVFRLRVESRYGEEKKIIDNVLGYGILFGKNSNKGNNLFGLFQYFDYWNNKIFELGSLGFGPGLISKIPFGKHSNIYSGLHLAIVPLAGNNTRFGPDTSEFRTYNFGGGLEARMDETVNLNKWMSVGLSGYYYFIHTYVGFPGNSWTGILKPRVTLRLFGNTSLGLEHQVYINNRTINGIPDLHLVRTEQKIFLQFYFEDFRRRGAYQ